MKHFLRDSIIFVYDLLGKTGRYRRAVGNNQPLIRILAFHDIEDATWFESVVEHLFSRYHFITPDDFLNGNFSSDTINLLLTFDDGYQSWQDVVAPILKKHDIKALFFICSGLLDIATDTEKSADFMTERLRIRPRAPLTWEGAQMLLEDGHTLGGHTNSHLNLAQARKSDRDAAVGLDKERIEAVCQLRLDFFAFPFGTEAYIDKPSLKTVTEAGYVFAVSAIPAFVESNEFLLPRTLIENNQSLSSIYRWVEGGYDLFWKLKSKRK